MAKLFCDRIKKAKGIVSMQSELGQRMPFCSFVKQPEKHPIEQFREQPFEHWDGALPKRNWCQWMEECVDGVGVLTWRISSKSHAASFFISETLL